MYDDGDDDDALMWGIQIYAGYFIKSVLTWLQTLQDLTQRVKCQDWNQTCLFVETKPKASETKQASCCGDSNVTK